MHFIVRDKIEVGLATRNTLLSESRDPCSNACFVQLLKVLCKRLSLSEMLVIRVRLVALAIALLVAVNATLDREERQMLDESMRLQQEAYLQAGLKWRYLGDATDIYADRHFRPRALAESTTATGRRYLNFVSRYNVLTHRYFVSVVPRASQWGQQMARLDPKKSGRGSIVFLWKHRGRDEEDLIGPKLVHAGVVQDETKFNWNKFIDTAERGVEEPPR